ncbi:hypothetical protein TNCV_2078421 [Trichonephila clavipes]|nr:hypothetical protein TNCV_2078421 [Trichonephila clavipes]
MAKVANNPIFIKLSDHGRDLLTVGVPVTCQVVCLSPATPSSEDLKSFETQNPHVGMGGSLRGEVPSVFLPIGLRFKMTWSVSVRE